MLSFNSSNFSNWQNDKKQFNNLESNFTVFPAFLHMRCRDLGSLNRSIWYASSLSRASIQSTECFPFFSILSGCAVPGSYRGWWPEPYRTEMVGNIFHQQEGQATFPIHTHVPPLHKIHSFSQWQQPLIYFPPPRFHWAHTFSTSLLPSSI